MDAVSRWCSLTLVGVTSSTFYWVPAGTATIDQQLARIVRSVLLVARLGEADHRGWWGTRSFGAVGRVVLKQGLPRTWRMAAIELDLAAAAHRHDEIIDRRNAVHLFTDNWPVRRWASAWVAEQKIANVPDPFFEQLETMTAERIADELRTVEAVEVTSQAVRVGSVSRADFTSAEALARHVAGLASVYANLAIGFAVPYLEVE